MDIFAKEKAHLEKVLQKIQNELERTGASREETEKRLLELRRYMWDQIREMSYRAKNRYDMMDQGLSVTQAEAQYGLAAKQARILRRQLQTPYFARIDFMEDGCSEVESIYIGEAGFTDHQSCEAIVCDWRSDIAALFYNFESGAASFTCPGGTISGELLLKRQFTIEHGTLRHLFDTTVAITDHFLRDILSTPAAGKMKTIVASIQKQQNEIIRDTSSDVLLIDGCAGSGKTSVALHRAAYLLYRNKSQYSGKNFMVLSPSDTFSSYIADVLPSLGEEDVWYSTFTDLALRAFGESFEVESFLVWTAGRAQSGEGLFVQKSDPAFCDLSAQVLQQALQAFDYEDLYLGDHLLCTAGKLREEMEQNLCNLHYAQSFQRLYDQVMRRSRDLRGTLSASIEDRLIDENGAFFYTSDEDLARSVRLERLRLVQQMQRRLRRMLRLEHHTLYGAILRERFSEQETTRFAKEYENCFIRYEDVPGLLLVMRLLGLLRPDYAIRHIIVDEAQDYSYLQYRLLGELYPYARFTILGDLRQRLAPTGDFTLCFDALLSASGKPKKSNICTMQTNYRSTKEIVQYANRLADAAPCQWVERSGGEVEQLHLSAAELPGRIASLLGGLEGKTAVITADAAQAAAICAQLREAGCKPSLVRGERSVIETELAVIPYFLAKGLEFDNVAVLDFGSSPQPDWLYIACTRALHHLTVVQIQ